MNAAFDLFYQTIFHLQYLFFSNISWITWSFIALALEKTYYHRIRSWYNNRFKPMSVACLKEKNDNLKAQLKATFNTILSLRMDCRSLIKENKALIETLEAKMTDKDISKQQPLSYITTVLEKRGY